MFNKKIILLIVLSLFLIGCRTSPVVDISGAPLNTASGKAPSVTTVKNKIVQAGIQLGWQMKKVKPGLIVATLNLRKHMVMVDINYSNKAYSINYKDSNNMGYDGKNIHANYNSWVQNLSKAINSQVYNSEN